MKYEPNKELGLVESEAVYFNEACEALLKTTNRSNCEAKLMSLFYRTLAEKQKEDKDKASFNMKADQIQSNVDFNNQFLDYLKSYEVK